MAAGVPAASAIEFKTMRKNGKGSANWLRTPTKPAEKRPLVFAEGHERCEVRIHTGFSDGSHFDLPVDYRGIRQVIATDEDLYSK